VDNNSHRFLWVLCLLAMGVIGSPLVAQQASSAASPSNTGGSGNGQGIRRTIGKAYAADQISTTTQTLADGTKITHTSLQRIFQDSEGRMRREFYRSGTDTSGQDELPQSVRIYDPLAGVNYTLNPRDHTAQKEPIRRPTLPPVSQTTGAQVNRAPTHSVEWEITREDLGTQVIEGLEARGERITRTIPAGAEGNDQPIQITDEFWVSPDAPGVLMTIINDPRRGETVTRLTNIVFEEPPAELFQVPADYTLKELQTVPKPEPPSD